MGFWERGVSFVVLIDDQVRAPFEVGVSLEPSVGLWGHVVVSDVGLAGGYVAFDHGDGDDIVVGCWCCCNGAGASIVLV